MTEQTTVAGPVTFAQWQTFMARTVAADFEPTIRRRHRRYSVHGEVTARFENAGKCYKRSWQLLEVSLSGLMIKTYEEIDNDLDMQLVINLDGHPITVAGRVVHCTQTLGGYKLGIELHFAQQ